MGAPCLLDLRPILMCARLTETFHKRSRAFREQQTQLAGEGLPPIPALPFTPSVTLAGFPTGKFEWFSKSPVDLDHLGIPVARCMLGNQLSVLVRAGDAGSIVLSIPSHVHFLK